jgi:Ca2+-binding RTX toxin-like protein
MIMVQYIRSDLDFILKQIEISEAHAQGQPLYGPGGLIPTYNLSWGLRTVDGSYNNLLNEKWGAADQPFPSLLDPVYRSADGTPLDMNGPAPGGLVPTSPNYNPSNNPNSIVVDSSLRTISNLLVDQTLGNPAAVITALARAGAADPYADLPAVTAIYTAFKPAWDAEYDARVVKQNAASALNAIEFAIVNPESTPAQVAAAEAAKPAAVTALENATNAHNLSIADLEAARVVRDAALEPFGIAMDGDNVALPAVAPDLGLSAPFNSWFTLFGQFFDHGLDLVNKGGSGTVFIPLQPDDPLYVPGSPTNFMVLTRATVSPGVDGIMGTADDVKPINTTTPFVDQNQTYTSHSSHQVFLRQYEMVDGRPQATGKLIEGDNGGMATWGEVKAQALMLGIKLTDFDVGSVPLLRTDQYGNFIPDAAGFAQVIVGVGVDGIPNTGDDVVVSGTPGAPVDPTVAGAIRTAHAFLADIAHDAVPVGKIADGDITIGLANPGNGSREYDNELLDAHFIAGDGRVNENIGLTAVHHVFHSEHNRLVEHTKAVALADAQALLAGGATQAEAVAFLNEWLDVPVSTVPASVEDLNWNGNRVFQAAKFGTEMQYQHLVFEEFARKIQPSINTFLVPDGFDVTLNPTIVAEFAHVVYRFGHSMLTETIDRFDESFTSDQITLIDGFLNPNAFNGEEGTIPDEIAAGAIIRGMTRQVGNEIDEFVTSALRNNLLGLPLDLATINLARGRDTGVPSLNAARREFYEMTNQEVLLKPYESWVDFAGHLKNEASIINFIAAYGTHPLITGQTTVNGKRDAALTIITGNSVGGLVVPADATAFLNATGAWAGGSLGGLENVDLWIGGLAEETMPFGGMLGSTFNFVFEVQMEQLQSGDRFYYLQRLDGLHLFSEMEANSFAGMIMRNTDATHLPSDVFSTPGLILEVDQSKQFNDLDGDGVLESGDPTGGGLLTPLVVRDGNYLRYTGDQHTVMGGTEQADTIIASEGDDTLFGDGGGDKLQGGFGNDIINGGAGDDVIEDVGGDDNIKGGDGNDAIHAGPGLDLVLGGAGKDFIVLGRDEGSEVFGGTGDDFILGNKNAERILGNEGNDWLETGTFDGAPGDNFDEIFAHDGINGHDVFLGDGGFDEFIGEGGDDIMVGSPGRGKMAGMSGFDWATYKDNTSGVNANINIPIIFDEAPTLPANASLDEYESIEGLSGSRYNDVLTGTNDVSANRQSLANGGDTGYLGSILDSEGIAMIDGLAELLGGTSAFDAGDIILGGAGSDIITGLAGNDVIDGDKWLNVRISVRQNVDGTGPEIGTANSMKQLMAQVFSGQINPGQLVIVREIISTGASPSDDDIAVFSGNRADYDISYVDDRILVNHARGTQADGLDTLSNIEMLRFADGDVIPNRPATGAPTINDQTPTEGQTLTTNTAGIADPNGLGAFSYQWQSSADGTTWTNIAGATGATFTPVNAAGQAFGPQAGLQLRVQVRFTDGDGTLETVNSVATGPTGVNWAGTNGANTLNGTAGDDIATAGGGADVLNGNLGNDNLSGQDGADQLNGGGGADFLNGGNGNDVLTGGTGNDTLMGGSDTDTAVFSGPIADYDITTGSVVHARGAQTDGSDTLQGVEILRFNGINYTMQAGTNANNNLNGGNGNQIIFARNGNDSINGNLGDDIIYGEAGNDTITQSTSEAGRDFADGGSGTDTYVLNGNNGAENFSIMTRTAAISAGLAVDHASTEIVITRNGTVIAELDNIEEIVVNSTNTTANDGNGVVNSGTFNGDTVTVVGDFTSTSLDYSTITVNGGNGQDTVDITGLTSDHRLVFNADQSDGVIGTLRPQDEFNVPGNASESDFALSGSMMKAAQTLLDVGSSSEAIAWKSVAAEKLEDLGLLGALNVPAPLVPWDDDHGANNASLRMDAADFII